MIKIRNSWLSYLRIDQKCKNSYIVDRCQELGFDIKRVVMFGMSAYRLDAPWGEQIWRDLFRRALGLPFPKSFSYFLGEFFRKKVLAVPHFREKFLTPFFISAKTSNVFIVFITHKWTHPNHLTQHTCWSQKWRFFDKWNIDFHFFSEKVMATLIFSENEVCASLFLEKFLFPQIYFEKMSPHSFFLSKKLFCPVDFQKWLINPPIIFDQKLHSSN